MPGCELEPGLPGLQTDAMVLASHWARVGAGSFGSKSEKVSEVDVTILAFMRMSEAL